MPTKKACCDMPKYRQLHLKILDSFDFSEMPDDFTRIVWLLLILIVDSAGRGINNPAWIKARMFPLRQDVTDQRIEMAMEWFTGRGMVITYDVSGRQYFEIKSFKAYQTGTDKEAKTNLPAPPDPLPTSHGATPDLLQTSEPTPDLLRVNAMQYNAIQDNTDAEAIQDRNEKIRSKAQLSGASAPSLETRLLNCWPTVVAQITQDKLLPRQTAKRLFGCEIGGYSSEKNVLLIKGKDSVWLIDHMTSTVERILPGIIGRDVSVLFVEA
jgi:hypothetical protein